MKLMCLQYKRKKSRLKPNMPSKERRRKPKDAKLSKRCKTVTEFFK